MITKAIQSYCNAVHHLVDFVGRSVGYIMPLLAFVVVFEVVARYFFDSPTIWAYDLSLFMFGYISALSGAYAQQKRAHINVDILYNHVRPKVRSIFNILSFSIALIFALIIIYMSIDKFYEAIEFNYRRQSEWAPHMHHFWVMMVVACGLLSLQLISDILLNAYFFVTGKKLIPNAPDTEEFTHGN
ncbi:TRAP-type mannitol/chloroaromatic compound transport system, small permease component [Oceanospirillum multiglobuliferum]|uniref:TRAP transporter small permease protein n=1 Tax=Oceanospirillum multiglobuliferum TaxID=64969 RepID=A0A1T4Q3L0_9GAMM|nr:TRAP transporter small permease [Oceanospirillum multiglobuliferum]OPX55506.1 C4-dicarboxylate ABC transporter permease [Oceanospirillum multiglobuliferum]SJZ98353.1 TRAP-type mannitol/chloroaromatic compound transport system, small permease component [Oceanospirillum multiglobuliferum]